MKNILMVCVLFSVMVQSASADLTFVNEQTPIVAVENDSSIASWSLPTVDTTSESDELRRLAEQIRKDAETIRQHADEVRKQAKGLEGAGYVIDQTPRANNDDGALERRVSRLEQRVDEHDVQLVAIEDKLKAIVTVRGSDGKVTSTAVSIDNVAGYGSFQVPVGGVVTHIDGQPVQRASVGVSINSTPTRLTKDYAATVPVRGERG